MSCRPATGPARSMVSQLRRRELVRIGADAISLDVVSDRRSRRCPVLALAPFTSVDSSADEKRLTTDRTPLGTELGQVGAGADGEEPNALSGVVATNQTWAHQRSLQLGVEGPHRELPPSKCPGPSRLVAATATPGDERHPTDVFGTASGRCPLSLSARSRRRGVHRSRGRPARRRIPPRRGRRRSCHGPPRCRRCWP